MTHVISAPGAAATLRDVGQSELVFAFFCHLDLLLIQLAI